MTLTIRVVVVVSVVCAICSSVLAHQLPQAGAPCNVTAPNGIVAGSSERHEGSYGTALLSVGPFGLWSQRSARVRLAGTRQEMIVHSLQAIGLLACASH
jgi:hypothetical protein